MKKLFIAIVCTLVLVACGSKTAEEKAIDQLKSLIELAEKEGASYDKAQWDAFGEKFEAISKGLDELNFSEEQEQELEGLAMRFMNVVIENYETISGEELISDEEIEQTLGEEIEEAVEEAVDEVKNEVKGLFK